MNKRKLLTGPYLVWAIAFILIPLAVILYYGLTNSDGHFTFENILAIGTMENFKALCLSLLLSFISTLICLILAYPLAMMLSNMKVSQTSFMVLIFILPMWMNFLLRTMAWQTLLEKNGVINQVLGFFGIPALEIINTPAAVVLGMVYDYLPFMILPIYNAVTSIDEDIIEAARDLGADTATVRQKIILPLSRPGIISGITMVFVPSLTEFVVPNILGGGKVLLLGNVIEQEFIQSMNWNLGSGLSVTLMVFVIISMIFTMKNDTEDSGALVW